MIYFSQRRKLAQLFEEHRRKDSGPNGMIASCPENVIAFLSSKGLLNEDKTREYLKKNEPKT